MTHSAESQSPTLCLVSRWWQTGSSVQNQMYWLPGYLYWGDWQNHISEHHKLTRHTTPSPSPSPSPPTPFPPPPPLSLSPPPSLPPSLPLSLSLSLSSSLPSFLPSRLPSFLHFLPFCFIHSCDHTVTCQTATVGGLYAWGEQCCFCYVTRFSLIPMLWSYLLNKKNNSNNNWLW